MRWMLLAAALIGLSPAAVAAQSGAPCALDAADRAWLDASVRGWVEARRTLLRAPAPASLDAIIFDAHCQLTSGTALRTGRGAWQASPVPADGIVAGGQRVPVGVVSAAIGDASGTRFVMSTPSVWAKGGVTSKELGLDRLMTAVLIHEATHVFQTGTYGGEVERLQKAQKLPDDRFNDDAIQAIFGKDREFASSVDRETRMFFDAAAAPDPAAARRLARQARELMCSRAARYYVGDQAYQRRAEDLWLTMEGTAQWAGYRWLQLPAARGGGGLDEATAMSGFARRGKSWTQLLGIAITLTVERVGPAGWRGQVFGAGRKTLLALLDEGIGSGGCPSASGARP